MSLSRDALARWLWQRFGDLSEEWNVPPGVRAARVDEQYWLDAADELALQFNLPLDADGPGITRCTCGHPVGNHRNGNGACRDKALTPRGMENCKCEQVAD